MFAYLSHLAVNMQFDTTLNRAFLALPCIWYGPQFKYSGTGAVFIGMGRGQSDSALIITRVQSDGCNAHSGQSEAREETEDGEILKSSTSLHVSIYPEGVFNTSLCKSMYFWGITPRSWNACTSQLLFWICNCLCRNVLIKQ